MTAENYALENMQGTDLQEIESVLIGFAKLKCEELLQIVLKSAEIYIPDGAYMDCYVNPDRIEIDSSSILDAVNLDEFIK